MATKYPRIAQFLQYFAQANTGVDLKGRTPEDIWQDFLPTPLQAFEDALTPLSTEDIQLAAGWSPCPGEIPPTFSPDVEEISISFMHMLWDEEETARDIAYLTRRGEICQCGKSQFAGHAYVCPHCNNAVTATSAVKHRANMRVYAACYGVII